MADRHKLHEISAPDVVAGCFCGREREVAATGKPTANMRVTHTGLREPIGGRRSSSSKAVGHATRQAVRELIAGLESSLPPMEAVRAFIAQIVGGPDCQREFSIDAKTPEVALRIPDVDAVIAAASTDIEAFFRRTITVAQNNGTMPRDTKPKELACFLMGVLLGIRVLAHARPDRSLLEGIARSALEFLDVPVRPKKE